jgi:hypothetical protein
MRNPQINSERTMQTQVSHLEQENSIRWILNNRRPEVSISHAIQTLQFALCGDRSGLKLLDRIEREHHSEVGENQSTNSLAF